MQAGHIRQVIEVVANIMLEEDSTCRLLIRLQRRMQHGCTEQFMWNNSQSCNKTHRSENMLFKTCASKDRQQLWHRSTKHEPAGIHKLPRDHCQETACAVQHIKQKPQAYLLAKLLLEAQHVLASSTGLHMHDRILRYRVLNMLLQLPNSMVRS